MLNVSWKQLREPFLFCSLFVSVITDNRFLCFSLEVILWGAAAQGAERPQRGVKNQKALQAR